MGFFNSLANIEADYRDILAQRRRAREQQYFEEDLARKKALTDEAYQKVIELQQQRSQAEDPQTPLRFQQWGIPEQLNLYRAYGEAGINPKALSENQIARQKAKAFSNALEQIKNPAARINIAQGKEYKPVDIKGDTAFNPYDTNNWLLGTTPKGQAGIAKTKAETQKQNLDTLEQAYRLNVLHKNLPSDPLLAIDAAQKKPLFNTEKMVVEKADGSKEQGYFKLTPSGGYSRVATTDQEGKALSIPPEGESELIDKVRNQYYAKLWNIPEAEAAERLKSKLTDTPTQAWNNLYKTNSKLDFTGSKPKAIDSLTNTITDWIRGSYGEPFPVDVKAIINGEQITDKEKEGLLSIVDNYDQAIAALNTPIPTQQTPAPPPTQIQPPAQPMIPPSLTNQPKPLPTPQPSPTPQAKPLDAQAINTAFMAIQDGTPPEQVQQGLEKAGYNLSPESVGLMAIDAVNSGVPPEVMQQYLAAIGIKWDTPKG